MLKSGSTDSLTNILSQRMQAEATVSTEEMTEIVASLKDHYILCGAGRTGMNIVGRFCETGTPFVVIEQSPTIIEQLAHMAQAIGRPVPCLAGDATEDETLLSAGINRAKGLITALNDDKDNLFVVLTARSLNPYLRIVSRVNDDKNNREKLLKAGASKVVSTNVIGGLRMASEMIRPEVVAFLDQMLRAKAKEKTLRLMELPLNQIQTPAVVELLNDHPAGQEHNSHIQLADIGKHTGLLVVAVKSPSHIDHDHSHESDLLHINKRYRFTPKSDTPLHIDDILVVIGTQDKVDQVRGIQEP